MVDLLGPGDAGAPRALTTTTDVTNPLAGDTWFGDCVGGVAGTGTPIVSKWLNRAMQQIRRVIRASGIPLSNPDDDMLGQAIQSGGLTYAVAGGAVNAYTVTLNPVPLTIPDGMEINVFFGTPNTNTSPTLAAIVGSPIPVLRQSGAAPAAGDLSGPISLIAKGGNWLIDSLAVSDVAAAIASAFANPTSPISPFTTTGVGAMLLGVGAISDGAFAYLGVTVTLSSVTVGAGLTGANNLIQVVGAPALAFYVADERWPTGGTVPPGTWQVKQVWGYPQSGGATALTNFVIVRVA